MANNPTASFEHVWASLMRALGITHPKQLRVNRVLMQGINQRMGRK